MAKIIFYDTTELDKQQLTDGLSVTDHQWEFVDDEITNKNINPDAEIISVFVSCTVTREMIEAMPKLTLICCRSTGYNNIDLSAAKERNITVVNVPVYGDATVAEYAFTMLLALTRKLEAVLESEHEQFHPPELTGVDLSGKTFGVIGAGSIGQKALKIANGFSMRTLAHDPFPKEGLDQELGFSYVSLDELLAQSDFISLHVPYNKDTHHLIGKHQLSAMKAGAIIINTARGALINTPALIEALSTGHLGGAALDVIEGEKLLNLEEELALIESGETEDDTLRRSVEISALKKMPNVIVSPHNAYNTTGAIGRINGTTVQNIIDFYNGHIPNCIECKVTVPGNLILLRHAESEWNAKGVWSGIADCGLSEKGWKDTRYLGEALKETGMKIDVAIHTRLTRTEETLEGVCKVIGNDGMVIIEDDGIMERDYGQYTGQDKWKIKEVLGEEQFHAVRRGWDVPVPDGETLKDTYNRVVPAYKETILPYLRAGKNVLVIAHGNSLRALMKYIESISDEEIPNVEMIINQISIYEIDSKTGQARSGKTIVVDTPTGYSKLA